MSENVPDISENIQGGCSILYTDFSWWGQLLYKETAPISNGNKHYKNVPQYPRFAVSPEIVPALESHRNVASLISSQNRTTFGWSFNCQGARDKIPLTCKGTGTAFSQP